MSHFISSQSTRLCEAVDRYAQKLGFIGKNESVECKICPFSAGQWLIFANGHTVTVAITDTNEAVFNFGAEHWIFPCGQTLDRLVKHVAKCVVHELFDAEGQSAT